MPLALVFRSPAAALVALGVLLPLAALAAAEVRAARARRLLRLEPPAAASRLAAVVSLLAIAALVGVAAAQPTIREVRHRLVRTDAAAMLVVDTSRSMLASKKPGGETRFARARAAAERLRDDLSEVPAGLASLTDRVLPLLLPTDDEAVFTSVLERALAVDSPPPQARAVEATTLASVTDLVAGRYFPTGVKRRLAIVLTDGESRPVNDQAVARALRRGHVLGPIFIRIWGAEERVYDGRIAEPAYRPDPASGSRLEALARAVGGGVYSIGQLGAAAAGARRLLGSGPVARRGRLVRSTSLAPYAVLAVLAPLGFLLWRRNLR